MNFTTKLVTAVSGEPKEKQTEGASPNSGKAKSELTDVTKALKRKLSEKMIRASTASYRSFRAAVKEGQSAELANVPRVFATKQTTIAKTHQTLNAMPKAMAEMDELYDTLARHMKK